MNLWWLEQLHITVEAYPPNGAAAHPAQLSARAMHSCTLKRAACCSHVVLVHERQLFPSLTTRCSGGWVQYRAAGHN